MGSTDCTVNGCEGAVNRSGLCFKHKVQSIRLDPYAMPTRETGSAPPAGNNNSWEKGRVTDDRGMPLMGPNGPVTVKEYANDRAHYEDVQARLHREKRLNTKR